jgi:hypothetical protein
MLFGAVWRGKVLVSIRTPFTYGFYHGIYKGDLTDMLQRHVGTAHVSCACWEIQRRK